MDAFLNGGAGFVVTATRANMVAMIANHRRLLPSLVIGNLDSLGILKPLARIVTMPPRRNKERAAKLMAEPATPFPTPRPAR
ncbi:MAG: hypothetical protein JRN46_03615 [Nitrososphaerota archaeon]|nr:hypothetical protein [Nitrososphaerota archaeon]